MSRNGRTLEHRKLADLDNGPYAIRLRETDLMPTTACDATVH